MFPRNQKSQNTTSVSKCTHRLAVAVGWVAALCSVSSGVCAQQAVASTSPEVAANNAPPVSAASGPNGTAASNAAASDAATRVIAREFATRGAEAFDRGDYALALDDFNRASALFGAPTITLMQARALVKLGRWLEGLDHYQRTARQTLDPSDPPPFHDAVRQAGVEGETLRQQLPQLSLLVDTHSQPPIVVELDGQTLPSLLLNTQRPIDPGFHKLEASRASVTFLERTIETKPGEHIEIRVTPPAVQSASLVRAPQVATVEKPAAPATQVHESPPTWPLVTVATIGGVGALGVGLTTVLGSLAQARLDRDCYATTLCEREQKGDIDALQTARTLFYVSGAMLVIGGGLTTYLLVSGEDGDGAQTTLSLSPLGADVTTKF